MIERQEIYCHECGKYVQFGINMELNGNHVLTCPVCGHEHCRKVEDGKITDIRWQSRNNDSYIISSYTCTFSSNSTYATCTSSNTFTANFNITYTDTTDTCTIDITKPYIYASWLNCC